MVSGHHFSWRLHLPSCDGLEMWLRPLRTLTHWSPGRICSRARCWRLTLLLAWRLPSGNLSKPIFCNWCEHGEEPGSINLAGTPKGRAWLALIYPSNAKMFMATRVFSFKSSLQALFILLGALLILPCVLCSLGGGVWSSLTPTQAGKKINVSSVPWDAHPTSVPHGAAE